MLNGPSYAGDGSISEEKGKLNQSTTPDAYIDSVSGETFHRRKIYFTKGANGAQVEYNQKRRNHLVF